MSTMSALVVWLIILAIILGIIGICVWCRWRRSRSELNYSSWVDARVSIHEYCLVVVKETIRGDDHSFNQSIFKEEHRG